MLPKGALMCGLPPKTSPISFPMLVDNMEKSPGLLSVPFENLDAYARQERLPWKAKKTRYSWNWLYGVIAVGLFFNMLHLSCLFDSNRSLSKFKTAHANSTLGFGAIYAVSRSSSPRRIQLERSADLTGLDIRFPVQPKWTDNDIQEIKAEENSTISRGSALAWLGHLNALRRFLDSPYESALIVEDDIDFDTHIRTEQIPGAANAIRELLGEQQQTTYYYGHPDRWDIIWLGHCGDAFDVARASKLSSIKVFTDTTLPLNDYLLESTIKFLRSLGIAKHQQRIVHRSVNPLCTFAYAVSRDAAKRLVTEYAAREPSRAQNRPCEAYDVRLLEACRDDGFKCITITPELFHHTLAPSEIAAVSSDTDVSDGSEGSHADTPNIKCSARSHLWWMNKKTPYKAPRLTTRERGLSKLAQKPGICYLDRLR